MNRITRLDCPVSLELQKEKSHQFADSRLRNPAHVFQWATINGQRFNHICKPVLNDMTNNHCAYCDIDNLGTGPRFTIDHLRPKNNHPRLSHIWINLYPSCDNCQSAKGEITNKNVLKPDDITYHFDDFFTFNASNGKIEILPSLDDDSKNRAEQTIQYFGLNDFGRPTVRKKEFYKMESILGTGGNNPNGLTIEDFSYRFIWF